MATLLLGCASGPNVAGHREAAREPAPPVVTPTAEYTEADFEDAMVRAALLQRRREHPKIIALLEPYARSEHAPYQLLMMLGAQYQLVDDHTRAVEMLRRGIAALGPAAATFEGINLNAELSYSLVSSKRFAEAIPELHRALERGPAQVERFDRRALLSMLAASYAATAVWPDAYLTNASLIEQNALDDDAWAGLKRAAPKHDGKVSDPKVPRPALPGIDSLLALDAPSSWDDLSLQRNVEAYLAAAKTGEASGQSDVAHLLRRSMVRRVIAQALAKAAASDPMGCLVELADLAAKHPGLPAPIRLEATKLEFSCSLDLHEYLRAMRLGELLRGENREDFEIVFGSTADNYLTVFRATFAYVSFDPVTGAVRDDADDGDFLGHEMTSHEPGSGNSKETANARAKGKDPGTDPDKPKLKNYDSISDSEDWADIFAWAMFFIPEEKPSKEDTDPELTALSAKTRKKLIAVLHARIAARNYELPLKIWLAALSLGDPDSVLSQLPGVRHATIRQDLEAALARDLDRVPEATARAYRVAREGAALLSRIARSRKRDTAH